MLDSLRKCFALTDLTCNYWADVQLIVNANRKRLSICDVIAEPQSPNCPTPCIGAMTCEYQLGGVSACLPCPCNSRSNCSIPLNTTWTLGDHVQTTSTGLTPLVIPKVLSESAGVYNQIGFVQGVGSCVYSIISLVVTYSFREYEGFVRPQSRRVPHQCFGEPFKAEISVNIENTAHHNTTL